MSENKLTETKTVLMKNNELAVFLHKGRYNTEFVVGHLEEEETKIGDNVNEWYWGHYFGNDLSSAVKYFEEQVKTEEEKIYKYREELEKAKSEGFNIAKLNIAEECDNIFTFEYTEEDFGRLCKFVYHCYCKYDNIEIRKLVNKINDYIENEGMTIDDVVALTLSDLVSDVVIR